MAVVGPAEPDDELILTTARAVGAGLAAAGCTVVTGGLGGVMAAAARGARDSGGFVVGLLPGDDADAANEHVDLAVPTGVGEGRNLLVVRMAEVVVAVGGSWGTLSEVALARRRGTPVVAVHGWRVQGPAPDDDVVTVADAAAAVTTSLSLLSDAGS